MDVEQRHGERAAVVEKIAIDDDATDLGPAHGDPGDQVLRGPAPVLHDRPISNPGMAFVVMATRRQALLSCARRV
jgi:hypothetical protein